MDVIVIQECSNLMFQNPCRPVPSCPGVTTTRSTLYRGESWTVLNVHVSPFIGALLRTKEICKAIWQGMIESK